MLECSVNRSFDVREAFDQGELVFDLPTRRPGTLFGLVELIGRGVLLQGDLWQHCWNL